MKIADGARYTQSQDGGILLDIRRGEMFRINLVGSRILSLLRAGRDEPAIVLEISREFGASTDTIQADVREFLDALEDHELVDGRPVDKSDAR